MLQIYKICEALGEFEKQTNVIKIQPIWGGEMSAQDYFALSIRRVEMGRRLLLPGELGCALAHTAVYKSVVSQSYAALVLEEDIYLEPESLEKVTDIISTLNQPDFINFSKYRHAFKKTHLKKNIYIADTSKGFWGASAYYISPRMARYILKKQGDCIDIADNWQEFFVGCPYIPYYAEVFEHTGAKTRIGSRTTPPGNASIFHVLRLRLFRWRMAYLSPFRHIKNLIKSRLRENKR